ncbi:MAG: family oxidoreductase [Alphaproteobacteria bacterium]|nr:family oxidoreductase [Alphaproteobacteria bacterium]MDB5721408.1 family oxidoreductase [Alphaproteobacteria bacterium]
MSDFAGANILITGAASGIGAATATLLAAEGVKKLILVDLDEDRLRDFAFTLPCERQIIIGDVTDEQLWVNADLTGLSHAVVNAGIAAASPIVDTSFAEWRRVLSVNLDGAFLTLQAAMKAMQGAGGAIVLTASAAGVKAEPGIGAYASSKAAVIQLARVAAKEGAAARIRVNAIAPGGVETRIWHELPAFHTMAEKEGEQAAFDAMAKVGTPLGHFAQPEEIAGQIAFLLSDRAAYITGACLVSDGGYSL